MASATVKIYNNLVSPTQGLCAAFAHPDVIQLALALESREGRY